MKEHQTFIKCVLFMQSLEECAVLTIIFNAYYNIKPEKLLLSSLIYEIKHANCFLGICYHLKMFNVAIHLFSHFCF